MAFSLRPLAYEERKFTYLSSSSTLSKAGFIGYLRGDFGSSGKEFWTNWEDFNCDLLTSEFKDEFDTIINSLRETTPLLLHNRMDMKKYVLSVPESKMPGNHTTEYAFRIDTETYSYLLRCNLLDCDYNFYAFCYLRGKLDTHIEGVRNDIRFTDSKGTDQFQIPDGGKIRVTDKSGKSEDWWCTYLDPCHFEINDKAWDAISFAEHMEKMGCTYRPSKIYLPKKAFSKLPSSGETIEIRRYQSGYYPVPFKDQTADELNATLGVSKGQAAAMLCGSMFGWDCPAAQPENYDPDGNLLNA